MYSLPQKQNTLLVERETIFTPMAEKQIAYPIDGVEIPHSRSKLADNSGVLTQYQESPRHTIREMLHVTHARPCRLNIKRLSFRQVNRSIKNAHTLVAAPSCKTFTFFVCQGMA